MFVGATVRQKYFQLINVILNFFQVRQLTQDREVGTAADGAVVVGGTDLRGTIRRRAVALRYFQ